MAAKSRVTKPAQPAARINVGENGDMAIASTVTLPPPPVPLLNPLPGNESLSKILTIHFNDLENFVATRTRTLAFFAGQYLLIYCIDHQRSK